MDAVRTCNTCGKRKFITCFVKHKKSPDGVSGTCIFCNREKVKAWRVANPEKRRAACARYRGAHAGTLANKRQAYRDAHPTVDKEYYWAHREKSLQRSAEWAARNPDKARETKKQYAQRNIEPERARKREYKKTHKEQAQAAARKRRKENGDSLREKSRERDRKRWAADPLFRLTKILRGRLNAAIRAEKPPVHALDLLGCSIPELKRHLEAKFKPGMHWDNYGRFGWHIDHIIPCMARTPDGSLIFDLTTEADARRCFHYTNLQPMWAADNYRKKNRME